MTYQEAVDLINAQALSVWTAICAARTTDPFHPIPVLIAWPDLPFTPPKQEVIWCRVIIKHAYGKQKTLGGQGNRRFARNGSIFFQTYSPIGGGNVSGYDLAQSVTNSFIDFQHDNLWFRNERIHEAGNSGGFNQTNVIIDFTYDEIR